ncbi:MAG: ribonuclease D [Rhodospirillales bacterium]
MPLITDSATLDAFCRRLGGAEFVTVDTEFMRERTYWPILCLVQVAGPEDAAAIDALADGIDLAPLFELLASPATVKVFHAARQDLEIFYHLTGRLPAPLFDTQVAAMVCGFGDQVGYETLVANLARARLDKGSRFTDWSLRPLSQRQIDYALSDVTHLREAYRKLKQKLDASGRADWLAEEMANLTDPAIYAIDPLQAFRRMKIRGGNGRFLAVLRELAAWREREAQQRDIPRPRVLRDEALVEIAHHTPSSREDLARTRGLGRGVAEGPWGAQILAAVARGLAVPAEACPQPDEKRDLPRGIGPVCDLLKVLLKMKCDEQDVAQKLVASSSDIEMIAALGERAEVAALHGWRRQLFGADALELREGRRALAVRGKKLMLVDTAVAGDPAKTPESRDVRRSRAG